ncbi:MAG: ribosome maturation factor RimP [Oscillospiraceae bacterium]|nr:ribosome maturation factor RimP [Oscillospiraceae bacterium]
MSKITEIVRKLAEPVAAAEGCEIWDVEYVREATGFVLRVYIDKEGGVSIDDCERVSRRLDPLLDEADPIPDSYTFEVSSAGAERHLKRPSDFERFMGSLVEVKLYSAKNGAKQFVGTLAGYENGNVSVTANGEMTTFEQGDIASVRLRIG